MPETPATPAASDRPRLLGDIGGTNARFAWQAKRGGEIRAFASYPCVQFESLEAVMRHYLSEQGLGAAWQAAIGIARNNCHTGFSASLHRAHLPQVESTFGLVRRAMTIKTVSAQNRSNVALSPSNGSIR